MGTASEAQVGVRFWNGWSALDPLDRVNATRLLRSACCIDLEGGRSNPNPV